MAIAQACAATNLLIVYFDAFLGQKSLTFHPKVSEALFLLSFQKQICFFF